MRYPFLMFSLFSTLLSCRAQPDKSKNTASAKDNNSLVWEISGNGLQKPSYLMGTIHIICKEDYFWNDAMQKALNNSDKICMEMDMDDPSLQMKVSQGLLLPEGQSLKDFFSAEEYKKVSDYAQDSLHLPIMMLNKMKPIMMLSLMSVKANTCANTESYEMNIMSKAEKKHKEIIGLETAEEQIAALDKMNNDTVAHYIVDALNDKGNDNNQELQQMVNAYKNQDLAALYNIIIQSEEFRLDIDGLLFERNKKWMPLIAEIAKKQPTFFAVGAGHLWGDKGVISLLRAAGYTVKPLH